MPMQSIEEISGCIRDRIQKDLEFCEDISDEKLEEIIAEKLRDYSRDNYLTVADKLAIGRSIFHSMRKLDILQNIIEDPSVTEIMVNGPDNIFIEREGRLSRLDTSFESEKKLKDIIQQIVASCNRVVNDSSPIVDARLDDGSRVNVVLNPVAINGPILTIRRFPETPLIMKDLICKQSICEEAADLLEKLVISGYNIIVSGGTGSGKTTFLNALSAYIPKDERIITIEDSAELQIQGIDNLIRMETKNANMDGVRPIGIRDLIKTSLRMRPDRIIVGEVRGAEAMDMVCSAMNCGHDGSMSTVHANSAEDTVSRLETMILMGVELPLSAIQRQICSGVDIIVHLGRLRDKSRRVLKIVELAQYSKGEVIFNTLYEFEEEEGSTSQRVQGRLNKKGDIIHDEKLKSAGITL